MENDKSFSTGGVYLNPDLFDRKDAADMEKAISQVLGERARQNQKWGEQNHDPFTWLAILSEEVGEVSEAMLHDQFGGPHAGTLKGELGQMVAVGLQWLECLWRAERKARDKAVEDAHND